MNQKDIMKAYEQQRQHKENIQKRERLNQIRERQREIAQKNTHTETTKQTTKPVQKKVEKQDVKKQEIKKQEIQKSVPQVNISRQVEVQKKQSVQPKQEKQNSVKKNQTVQNNQSGKKTVKKTQPKRIQQKKTVRKKAKSVSIKNKQYNMTLGEFVKRIPEVAKETTENIQGAIYYVNATLKNAKEREEREEREDIYQENARAERQEALRYTKVKKAIPKIPNKKRSKFDEIKEWVRVGKRFELCMTACVLLLVFVVGGSVMVGLGDSDSSGGKLSEKIWNLINIMDFGNRKDDTEKENNTSNETKETITEPDSQTGVTGNYSVITSSGKVVDISRILVPDWIDRQFLTVSEFSRPGVLLDKIESVVIHYVGNAGTTAQNNRNYFESLKDTQESAKSSHFVVGLNGEVIQCIPLNEKSYATNHRNNDTISIEVCHPGEDGKFTDITYDAVIKLTAWLCQQFDLSEENIIRHYDVTQKSCPKYFVDHPDEWITFKEDVMSYMEANPNIK